MRQGLKAALSLVAFAALAQGCASAPVRNTLPVQNLTFRLNPRKGAYPDQTSGKPIFHVEMRLEEGYFPAAGYELVAEVEGSKRKDDGSLDSPILEPSGGATVIVKGVLEPLEKKQPAGPASALLDLPFDGSIEFVTWPLLVKYVPKDGPARADAYTLQHTKDGWRLSRPQGGFSRFEAQGSY